MNLVRVNFPCSIWRSLNSHSPVMAGLVNCSAFTAAKNWITCSALAVGISSRWARSMYRWLIRPSIVSARVAGVPRPRSFIASASSSSSTSLPAPSIAESSVASV